MFRRKTSKIVLASVVVAGSVALIVALIATGILPLQSSLSCRGISGSSRTFTIIANSDGYNQSRVVAGLGIWPVATVSRCDSVTFKIVNTDTQAHGFAVGYYSRAGLTIAPSQALSLSFVAVKAGQFRLYCIIICTVHDFMLNGQLNVT